MTPYTRAHTSPPATPLPLARLPRLAAPTLVSSTTSNRAIRVAAATNPRIPPLPRRRKYLTCCALTTVCGAYTSVSDASPSAQHNRPAYAPPAGPPPGAHNQGMHMPPTGQQHYGPQFENQSSHQVQQPYFQYSQCTGKKKALCVSA